MIDFDFIDWDDGNQDHIAMHDLTLDEVEDVLTAANPRLAISPTSGRPMADGPTGTGKYIRVIFETTNEGGVKVLRPVTVYEIDPP